MVTALAYVKLADGPLGALGQLFLAKRDLANVSLSQASFEPV